MDATKRIFEHDLDDLNHQIRTATYTRDAATRLLADAQSRLDHLKHEQLQLVETHCKILTIKASHATRRLMQRPGSIGAIRLKTVVESPGRRK